MESKYVYPFSASFARSNGDLELWRENQKQNIACKKAIEKVITEEFDGYRLGKDASNRVINEFGYDRVNWVLANTLQNLSYDGRFSRDNLEWAKTFYFPEDKSGSIDHHNEFLLNSHPAVLNGFVDQTRRQYSALCLYSAVHCMEDHNGVDFTNKVLVLSPNLLKDEYKKPEYQLVLAECGFGCSPSASGRKVFGKFLFDGERCQYNRHDFIGVLQDELVPEWASEKLKEMQQKKESEQGVIHFSV
ncbi:MAG: DUF3849 domain-containing protein [Clostridia bacterium]|nr:DUF3849 domain-containing protein [Clostridia bacterium]